VFESDRRLIPRKRVAMARAASGRSFALGQGRLIQPDQKADEQHRPDQHHIPSGDIGDILHHRGDLGFPPGTDGQCASPRKWRVSPLAAFRSTARPAPSLLYLRWRSRTMRANAISMTFVRCDWANDSFGDSGAG